MKKVMVVFGLLLAAVGVYAQSVISISVPELRRSVSYTAYQIGRAAEDQVAGIRAKVNAGQGTLRDYSSNLSAAVKKLMRERNIRVMFCRDIDYAVIRSTSPESFAIAVFDPPSPQMPIFPGDLPVDWGFGDFDPDEQPPDILDEQPPDILPGW
jgi:hypothetical protein